MLTNLTRNVYLDLPLNLPHLTVLNLSHNEITKIPDSLFGFIHLRLLDLSFNKIENVPSFISLFPDLRKMDLSHNQISKIPSSLNNLKKLEKLNLSHNKISHLPLSLGNLDSLQVLIARDNPLQLDIEVMFALGLTVFIASYSSDLKLNVSYPVRMRAVTNCWSIFGSVTPALWPCCPLTTSPWATPGPGPGAPCLTARSSTQVQPLIGRYRTPTRVLDSDWSEL